MEFFMKFINAITNNHYLYWFLFPFSHILVGTVIGAKQNQFHFYPFLLLYVFLLLTHLLENFLIKKQENKLLSSPKFRRFFFVSVIIVLILTTVAVNLPAVLLLVLYLVFLLLTYHSSLHLEQTIVYYVLQLFFQAFILNVIAYYIQSGYISEQFFIYLIPTVLLMSITIHQQQIKLTSSTDLSGTYLNIIRKYSTLITLTLYLGALVVIGILFNASLTDMSRQMLFILPIILFLFPLVSREFRKKLDINRYLSLLVWLSILLFSTLLKIK